MHFVRVDPRLTFLTLFDVLSHLLDGLEGYHCALCTCFTWQCKPGEGSTVHIVRVLRGNVSLGGVSLCTLCAFYVAM